ncbi:MAG: hypothetical protein HYR92_04435 [Burkholderiales bacterium]|nr:hypothetical protein [Burkholderiales bacterium]
MASFTYTVWTNVSLQSLVKELEVVFCGLQFSMINPRTGLIHLWNELGECVEVEMDTLMECVDADLPIGIQWWRGDVDIYTSIDLQREFGGLVCCVTLYEVSKVEQAEIAKLLILNIVPEKEWFPDDFSVFKLSAT